MERQIKRFPKIPSEDELAKLIETIMFSKRYNPNTAGCFLRWRDRTAVIIDFYAGLRPAEFLNLRWEDIDFDKKEIRISPYFNKQKIDIPAELTRPVAEALLIYKKVCADLGFNSSFIIPSVDNLEPLSTSRFAKIFRELAREAGILKIEYVTENGQIRYNYRPYSGRHWFGTQVFKQTNNQIATQKMLRHLKPESCFRYIQADDSLKKKVGESLFK